MLKCSFFALIGIVFVVRSTFAEENVTYRYVPDLDSARDLVLHFPRYLEDALRLAIDEEDQATNSTDALLFGQSQCFLDLIHLFTGLREKNLWAIRVLDSWGKLPSGILRGNMYDLGDFDECLNINEPNHFDPRYCLVRLSKDALQMPNQDFTQNGLQSLTDAMSDFDERKLQSRIVPTTSNMLGLNFGICIPKSCKQDKIEQLFKTTQERIFRNKAIIQIVPNTCQVKEDQNWNLDAADCVVLGFIIFLGVIMISSTIYDLVQTRRDKEKDEICIAFSVYTNGQKMFTTKRSKSDYTMNCLNGIRVFSALWVIYAHAHAMTIAAPIFNFAYVPEWTSHYSTVILLLAPFSVDTFLFLSGLLVTWSTLKHLNKTDGKANYFMIYIHRYLRLTPILAVIIIISLTLFKRIGSGPLWFSYILNAINCDKYWWSSLLYIQNYYNADTICLTHTWYLSVDMQLFLFAPLCSYLLYRFGYFIVAIVGLLVGVCVGWTYWLFVHFELVNQFLNMKNSIRETFILTYYPTHIRMSSWLIGVMFAYFLFKMHGRRERWHTIRVLVHWAIAVAIIGVLGYYAYELQQIDHKATSMESGIYTSVSRVLWGLFLCLLIYACVKGYGGPVNWFLSLSLWQPLARLTYAIYLLHMPIMLMTAASTKRPLIFSGQTILFKFFGDIMAATLLSIIASLALESPIVVLEKFVFGPKKEKIILPTTETHDPTAPAESSQF